MERTPARGLLRIAVLALTAGAMWFAGATFDGTPAPRGAQAPPTEFSAARADAVLGRLLGPELPHPVSSPANRAVRDRVRAEFAALGIGTSVYRALGCEGLAAYGVFSCGTAEDVLAEIVPGRGKAIVLMAHYDSVPAGPGAADDESGVAAILETVRALKARRLTSAHPVLALITDGEEAGLLGADAFAANPALRARVGVLVNVEARGNQGPSLLFQTSPGDGPLIDLYAASVPQLATGSLFAVVYRVLPNDTDLTVFLKRGFTGFNFAFIGDLAQYHTARDRRANLDLGSLQHHGDNLLGVATALMHTDFAALKGGDDVYLTLFGRFLPRLPAGWALPLAVLTLLLLAVAAYAARGEIPGIGRRLAALSLPLAAIVASIAAGWLLFEIAVLVSGQPDPSYAHPVWVRLSLAFGVAAVLLLVSRLAGARLTLLSVWFWMSGLAVLSAYLVPGLSPYFLFPSLVAAPLLLAATRLRDGWTGAAGEVVVFLAALPALAIWLSLAASAEWIQGLSLHPVFTVPVALGTMPLLALVAPRPMPHRLWLRSTIALAGAAALLAIVAGLQPAFSTAAPQRLNIGFLDDHIAGKALWTIDTAAPLPQAFRAAMKFTRDPVPATPLAFQKSFVAPAGGPRFAPPAATAAVQARGKGRSVVLALHGTDAADRMILFVPKKAGLVRAAIEDRTFTPAPDAALLGGALIFCATADCRDKRVTLEFADRRPVDVVLGEFRFGLPPDGGKLEEVRPAQTTPSRLGDATVVVTKMRLP
ncbi:MAG TPA: M20/M25/M40 family metallo-hydrolase [Rhizomicrobium sp.]